MRRFLTNITAFLLLMLSFGLILRNVQNIVSTSAPDFGVFFDSAVNLANHENPYLNPALYAPNVYPPVSELFYIPFTQLSYQKAQAVFVLMSFAAIVVSCYISIKLVNKNVKWQFFATVLGLTFLSFPTKFTLGMGQINAVAFLFLVLSFFFEVEKKQYVAGVFLAVSIILKPIFLLFPIYFAVNRSWKVLFASLLTISAAVALNLYLWGPAIWDSWYKVTSPLLSGTGGREIYYNQGFMGFVSRLTQNPNIRFVLSNLFSFSLIAASTILALKKRPKSLTFSLFVITLLLANPISWQHYFVWLIFPFVTLAHYTFKAQKNAFWIPIFLAFLLTSWNFKNPTNLPVILISNQFYGALILWILNFYILISMDTPAGRSRFPRESTVRGEGSSISIKRLWTRTS